MKLSKSGHTLGAIVMSTADNKRNETTARRKNAASSP
jgi:hypothetical protein